MATIGLMAGVMRSLRHRRPQTRRTQSSSFGASLSTLGSLPPLGCISVEEFREKAFKTESPALLTARYHDDKIEKIHHAKSTIPAFAKWFKTHEGNKPDDKKKKVLWQLDYDYLSKYEDVHLPYELVFDLRKTQWSLFLIDPSERHTTLLKSLTEDLQAKWDDVRQKPNLGDDCDYVAFQSFQQPMSLFLDASKVERLDGTPSLYIAQAQIADLPKDLQEDLPTPDLVKKAGKGDIYDANVWMGLPPTYTPLHKDPNPNLFVQLHGAKAVRLFRPDVGRSIFARVQQDIGQNASAQFRGQEMMEGKERKVLKNAIWGEDSAALVGFEAVVHPGDAVFIPKGWWHSFKSVGDDVSVSVNWWFR